MQVTLKIRVPATSANLGPGFDSLGIAVSSYLTVTVYGEAPQWKVDHRMGYAVPYDERNMIVATALEVNPELPPQHIKVVSDIPLAHGLGSSSSALIAGIVMANEVGRMHLSDVEILQKAAELEGHPDNVAPALYGDFVVSTMLDGVVSSVRLKFPDLMMVAYIPAYNLSTADARNVLPEQFPFSRAVAAGSVGNVLVAALAAGDMKTAGRMMENDQYHETYRARLVPHLATLRDIGHRVGAMATYLSGAGPTVMCFLPHDRVDEYIALGREAGLNDEYRVLQIEREGVHVDR